MKVTVSEYFTVRGKPISSHITFPEYSDKIEEALLNSVKHVNHRDNYRLEIVITK